MSNEVMKKDEKNTQITPVNQMKSLLSNKGMMQMFDNALKQNAGAFISSLIDLYNGDNCLQNCEPKDVAMEALKAATLNLPINKQLGFAYIVPYGKSPQFQIGYKGYIQLAMRTGQYENINAGAVYEGERIKQNRLAGTMEIAGDKTSDKEIGYFAYFKLINGFEKCLYMTKEEVENHAKKFSKSYSSKNSVWQTDFSSMATKTVLRLLLSKYGVMSTQMMDVIAHETDSELKQDIESAKQANTTIIDAEIVQEQQLKNAYTAKDEKDQITAKDTTGEEFMPAKEEFDKQADDAFAIEPPF